MRYDRDAVSPWAFFLPVALAVMVGSLVADAVGDWMRGRFADAPAPVVTQVVAPANAALDEASPVVEAPPQPALPNPSVAPAQADETPDPDAAMPAAPQNVATGPASADMGGDGARRLSGPMTARQAGESESCINNSVATRSPNGWEQALENDAPVRCEANSP